MQYKFSLNSILGFTAVFWTVFAGLSLVFSPATIFHILNPISIASGVALIITYAPAIRDAWENRSEGVSPAHMLAIGIALNWIGLVIRMMRWYITGASPATTWDLEFWFYNFGLWVSIWAALFIYGAASLVTPGRKLSTMLAIFLFIGTGL
jgi:hypothetical protein